MNNLNRLDVVAVCVALAGAAGLAMGGDQGAAGGEAAGFLSAKVNPGQTGFAVLDWMRRQSHLQNLPTIVLSNSDQPSDIENSLRLGAHGYWVKPTRLEDLVKMATRLKALLARVTERIEHQEAVPALA